MGPGNKCRDDSLGCGRTREDAVASATPPTVITGLVPVIDCSGCTETIQEGAWCRCGMDPRDKHEDDGRGWQPRAAKTVAPATGLSLLLPRRPRGRRRFALSAAAFFRGGCGVEHLVTEGYRGEAAGAVAGA